MARNIPTANPHSKRTELPNLQDELPMRLENLASNLARIKSRCQNAAHGEIIEDLLQGSKLFIEWTAADTEIEIAAELVELQVQLACWQYSWAKIRSDAQQRMKVGEQVKIWSEKVLDMSGLLAVNYISARSLLMRDVRCFL